MLNALHSREGPLLVESRLSGRRAGCRQRMAVDCVARTRNGQKRRAGPGLKDHSPAPGPTRPPDERLRPLWLSNLRRCAASRRRSSASGKAPPRRTGVTCVRLGRRWQAVQVRCKGPSHARTAGAANAQVRFRPASPGVISGAGKRHSRCLCLPASPGLLGRNLQIRAGPATSCTLTLIECARYLEAEGLTVQARLPVMKAALTAPRPSAIAALSRPLDEDLAPLTDPSKSA